MCIKINDQAVIVLLFTGAGVSVVSAHAYQIVVQPKSQAEAVFFPTVKAYQWSAL